MANVTLRKLHIEENIQTANALVETISTIINNKPGYSEPILGLFNSLPDPLEDINYKQTVVSALYEGFITELYIYYGINPSDEAETVLFNHEHKNELTIIHTLMKDELVYVKGENSKRGKVSKLKGDFLEKLTGENISTFLRTENFSLFYEATFHNKFPGEFENLIVPPPHQLQIKSKLSDINKIDFFALNYDSKIEEMTIEKNLSSHAFLIECKSSFTRIYNSVHEKSNQVEYLNLLKETLQYYFGKLTLNYISYENDKFYEKVEHCMCENENKCLQCFLKDSIEVYHLTTNGEEFIFESA